MKKLAKIIICICATIILVTGIAVAVIQQNAGLVGEELTLPGFKTEFMSETEIVFDKDKLKAMVPYKYDYVYIGGKSCVDPFAKKLGFEIDGDDAAGGGRQTIENENGKISISEDGTFTYYDLSVKTSGRVGLSDKECAKIAVGYIKKHGLDAVPLDSSYAFGGSMYVSETGEEYYTTKTVSAFPKSESADGSITVTITADGSVKKVYYGIKGYTEKIRQPLIGVEKAVELISNGGGFTVSQMTPIRYEIDNVTLSNTKNYSSDGKEMLQPVYIFTGKAEDAKGNTEALSVTVQANRIE